jgi:hypothetical protein
MGTTVLDAGLSRAGLQVHAQCTAGRRGSVTVLAMNTSRHDRASVDVPTRFERYTLSGKGAPDLAQLRIAISSLSIDDADVERTAADSKGVYQATARSLTRIGMQLAKDTLMKDFDEFPARSGVQQSIRATRMAAFSRGQIRRLAHQDRNCTADAALARAIMLQKSSQPPNRPAASGTCPD